MKIPKFVIDYSFVFQKNKKKTFGNAHCVYVHEDIPPKNVLSYDIDFLENKV